MENNIFEGAKFGDKFQMRNGWIAIYLSHYTVNVNSKLHRLCSELDGVFVVDNTGSVCQSDISNGWDIISRYQEPIDEDKLDELAKESMNKSIFNDPNKNDCDCDTAYYYGFVAGYRKAKEE